MSVGLPFMGMMLLLLGGTVGAPLGLPPLPEDPVMAQVAPADCVWYFSWSGTAAADPKSKNQTEALLAEPEVQTFISTVTNALGSAMQKGAPQTPQGQVLGAEGPKLIRALLTHPAAAFVSKVAIGERGPDITGGVVVGTGEQTDEIKAALEKIEKTLLPDAPAADAKWHKLPSPPGAPVVEWGFRGKYLIVGIGAGEGEQIATRAKSQPPAWLTNVKKKLSVERVSTVHYLNVKKVLEVAGPFLGGRDGRVILEALGVGNIQAFASVSGLEGSGSVGKTWLQLDGEPTGLLTFFGPEPLKAAELATIPKDASFALAARVQPARLFASIVEGLNKANPQAAEEFVKNVHQAEAVMGFGLKEDLLEPLGDSWCIYNSPGEGGLLFTGLTVVVPIKDREKLLKSTDALMKLAQLSMVRDAVGPIGPPNGFRRSRHTEIKEAKFQGQTIHFLQGIGEEIPFAPAWCVGEKHLILSLSPQNIRAFLARDPKAGSLADVPKVSDQLKAGGPVLITYQDTAENLKTVYPVVQILATLLSSELQREGLDIDASALPSLASILRHAEPGVATLSREKDGLLYVSRQSLPGGGAAALLPAAFFWSFSARNVARARFDVDGPPEIHAVPLDESEIERPVPGPQK